jgi:ATP-dependent Clp protease protease subunit
MSQKLKDNIDILMNHGIDPLSNTIFFEEEIDDESAKKLTRRIKMLDNFSTPITIILDSPGGDVYKARKIYDAIKLCQNEVIIVVEGEASSSASLILQAADERMITTNSYIMIHKGQEGYDGHPSNNERWREYNDSIAKWMEDVYLEKIKQKKKKFTRNQLKSLLVFDTIFTPKKCLEFNLIDQILES